MYAGWRRAVLGELIERRLRQGSAQDGEQIVLGPAMKAIEVKGDGIGDEGAFVHGILIAWQLSCPQKFRLLFGGKALFYHSSLKVI